MITEQEIIYNMAGGDKSQTLNIIELIYNLIRQDFIPVNILWTFLNVFVL